MTDVTERHPPMTVSPPPRSQSLALIGAAAGAACMLAAIFVYQLIRVGFHLAGQRVIATGASSLPTPDSPDKIFGVYVLGSLLTLPSAIASGAVVGGLLGLVLTGTWRRQGPIRAWLTGSLLAYVFAAIVNVIVLGRHRKVPWEHSHWLQALGYPSIIFIVVFGVLGLWLYLSRSWRLVD